jgi:hypothetical protein
VVVVFICLVASLASNDLSEWSAWGTHPQNSSRWMGAEVPRKFCGILKGMDRLVPGDQSTPQAMLSKR